MKPGYSFTASIFALSVAAVTAQAPVHDLPLTPEHVHWGYYDAARAGIAVASGDRVRVETMAPRVQRLVSPGCTEAEIPDSLRAVERA